MVKSEDEMNEFNKNLREQREERIDNRIRKVDLILLNIFYLLSMWSFFMLGNLLMVGLLTGIIITIDITLMIINNSEGKRK